MTTEDRYLALAQTYANGTRVLLADPNVATDERGRRGPVSYSELTTQAADLLPTSAHFTEAAVARLGSEMPDVRVETEAALLAKALTDLEISAYLLDAASNEEAGSTWGGAGTLERSRVTTDRTVDSYLQVVVGAPVTPPAVDRVSAKPANLATARFALIEAAGDSFALITSQVSAIAKTALAGLGTLGTGELVRAAGSVSMDIASALGQAEKVAKLYDLFRGFLGQAYDSLVALLGPHLVKLAGEEAKEWLTKVKEGEPVPSLLERLYETKELHAALKKVIDQTAVDLAQYEIASNELQRLNEQFRRQTSLLDKVLPKLKWGLLIPASALPQGKLVLGLFYIVLTGYAIYLGADYVDASRLQRLGRVPGVCSVIESQLNTGGEA